MKNDSAREAPYARSLPVLIGLAIANHTVLAGTRVIASLDALARGGSPALVGTLIALYALLPALFAVVAGRLTDRIGLRRPMLTGTIGIAVGAALPFVAPGTGTLFATAALIGLSFMAFQVAAQNATGEMSPSDERARGFSMLSLGYSTSGLIGPLVAGYAIDHVGHRAAFGLLALVPLAGIVVLARGRPPLPERGRAPASAPRGSPIDLLKHRTLRRVFAVNVLIAMAWDLHTIFVPIYGAKIGLTASQIGMVLAAFAAATFVVRLATPMLVRRASEERLLAAALVVAGIVYVAFPFVERAGALMALAFALGLGVGGGQPMVMALIHAHAPPGRMGEAVGMRMSLVNAMAVVVPIVFGALGASVGIAPVFWSVGALLAAGGVLARRGS